jgi:O-antigen ligase
MVFFIWATITGYMIAADLEIFLVHVRRVFICLLFLLCVFVAMRSSRNLGVLMFAYFVSSLFICGYSLYTGDLFDIINQEDISFEDEGEVYVTAKRLHGIAGNSNGMGSYAILGFISISYLFFETRSRILQALYVGAGTLFFYTIVAAGTRGGLFMGALYISLWALLVLRFKVKRGYILPAIFGALIVGGAYVYDHVIRTSTIGLRVSSQSSITEDKRASILTDALNIFLDNITTGVGLDQLQFHSEDAAIAHNEYLEVLGDTGLVGGLLYFPIFYIVLKRLVKYRSVFPDPRVRYQLNFLLTILLLMFAYGMIKHHVWDFGYILLLGIMVGYTSSLKTEYKLRF